MNNAARYKRRLPPQDISKIGVADPGCLSAITVENIQNRYGTAPSFQQSEINFKTI
jgi:hypothetical protein